MTTETKCRASDGEPCHCPACEAEWQRQHDYWRPLYEGEKAAGLLNDQCPHEETESFVCLECGKDCHPSA